MRNKNGNEKQKGRYNWPRLQVKIENEKRREKIENERERWN